MSHVEEHACPALLNIFPYDEHGVRGRLPADDVLVSFDCHIRVTATFRVADCRQAT